MKSVLERAFNAQGRFDEGDAIEAIDAIIGDVESGKCTVL